MNRENCILKGMSFQTFEKSGKNSQVLTLFFERDFSEFEYKGVTKGCATSTYKIWGEDAKQLKELALQNIDKPFEVISATYKNQNGNWVSDFVGMSILKK